MLHNISFARKCMPPKLKVTREQIKEASMNIAATSGIEAITAREIGKRLNVSSRPLYSIFSSVDDLKREIVADICDFFSAELSKDRDSSDDFFKVGLNYLDFARNHREFYLILHSTGLKYMDDRLKSARDIIVEQIRNKSDYYAEFTKEEMSDLYRKMGIFTHGLADMLARDTSHSISEEYARQLIFETGGALVRDRLASKGHSH